VVISREPIADTVPVMYSGMESVKIIQWDKRSAKHYFDKFDVLCLRGNDVLSNTQERVRLNIPEIDVEDLPIDDPHVYETMRKGQLIGVPQSASPAMRQAHIRIGTENLKDASIVQAGIRPGVGGAVKLNELIARRKGKEYTFLHPELERILGPTYGIVVFQEQIDMLLQTFGGYTSDEAEIARESIHKRRRDKYIDSVREDILERIAARGFSREVAKEVFELVAVFQGYGFAEGHALAFAEVSVRSIWCQQNFPGEYFAALLDAQPAGYYGPTTIANEARIRGVEVRQPDVNLSELKYRVEPVHSDDPPISVPSGAIRVSLEQISGVSKQLRERIIEERPFKSVFDFAQRLRPERDELEQLVLCGAFETLHPNRRALLWAVSKAVEYADASRNVGGLGTNVPEPLIDKNVEDFDVMEKAIHERSILDLDVRQHLMAFERERVASKGGVTAAVASYLPHGSKAFVVGNPIRLRFPPTSSGQRVMFFDLEDETGLLNVTCFNRTYLRYGHTVICSPYITIWGKTEERDNHIAFLASAIYTYTPGLEPSAADNEQLPITTADFLVR
jgi:error-prone DNA polymerase